MKKKSGFKSVKARLTFWFLVVALVPLLIMSGVISYQRVNAIKALEFSKLTAIRDFKADQVNNWLDERIGDIQTISEAFEIKALEQLIHKGEQPQNHATSLCMVYEVWVALTSTSLQLHHSRAVPLTQSHNHGQCATRHLAFDPHWG